MLLTMRRRSAAGLKSTPKKVPSRPTVSWDTRLASPVLGVDGVDAAPVADAVELAVLDAEVDADERGVRPLEAVDVTDVPRPVGTALAEPHQPLIGGEADDGQAPVLDEVGAVATARRLGATDPRHRRERQGDQNPGHLIHRMPPVEFRRAALPRKSAGLIWMYAGPRIAGFAPACRAWSRWPPSDERAARRGAGPAQRAGMAVRDEPGCRRPPWPERLDAFGRRSAHRTGIACAAGGARAESQPGGRRPRPAPWCRAARPGRSGIILERRAPAAARPRAVEPRTVGEIRRAPRSRIWLRMRLPGCWPGPGTAATLWVGSGRQPSWTT